MARKPRVVIPGVPLHVISRAAAGRTLFQTDQECDAYLTRLNTLAEAEGVQIHAYCLMTNHVHLLLTPVRSETAVSKLMQRLNTAYAGYFNRARSTYGAVFSRFYSSCLDDSHFWAAMRYIELNPVRAEMVKYPEQWTHSSARAHIAGQDNPDSPVRLTWDVFKNRARIDDWRTYLVKPSARETAQQSVSAERDLLNWYARTGRAIGSRGWLQERAADTSRKLDWPHRRSSKPPASVIKYRSEQASAAPPPN